MDNTVIEHPLITKIKAYEPVFWINEKPGNSEGCLEKLPITYRQILDTEARWKRFAPLLEELFPEMKESSGIIESGLAEIPAMEKQLEELYPFKMKGRLFFKKDNDLPVAGSIKARGGIYEVLKHAEDLAVENSLVKPGDDYRVFASPAFRELFSKHSIYVGSTGNLGMSIGIMGSALGFKVTVHMSSDAKEWKKKRLLKLGVNIIEHSGDYSAAVREARASSMQLLNSYFIDDENSVNLFLGYSTAALRLKAQLDEKGIIVDEKHPLFIYVPCGVGGAPGGLCFGLKHVFGDNVHCFFAEPTHSPCMLLGLMTGLHDRVSVQDFGLDNRTEADGLAVGRPSGFAGKFVGQLVSGVYTIDDDEMHVLLACLKDSEDIAVEPSSAVGLKGPALIYGSGQGNQYLQKNSLNSMLENSAHIVWGTGGSFVPLDIMEKIYERGSCRKHIFRGELP